MYFMGPPILGLGKKEEKAFQKRLVGNAKIPKKKGKTSIRGSWRV